MAIWVKVVDNSTGLGMVSGVASGAAALLLAFAVLMPELISVPITMPIDSVNRINVNESSFSVRNLSKTLMGTSSLLPKFRPAMILCRTERLFTWMKPWIQRFQFHQHYSAENESGAGGGSAGEPLAD